MRSKGAGIKMLKVTLLVTIGLLVQPQEPIVSDQLKHVACKGATLYTSLLERVGTQARLAGLEQSVMIRDGVELPRIDEQESSTSLSLTLVKGVSSWEVIQFNGFVSFEQTLQEQRNLRLKLLDKGEITWVRNIETFLVRESAGDQRWDMWISFRERNQLDEVSWLSLGGEFFSGTAQLGSYIEDEGMESSALLAKLHPHGDSWLATSDLALEHGLIGNSQGYQSSVRNNLMDQATAQLYEILKKSRKKRPENGVQLGSPRKSIRGSWGDPISVDWIRFDHHMLEHWQYSDRHVRLIDGRVYEMGKSAGLSLAQ